MPTLVRVAECVLGGMTSRIRVGHWPPSPPADSGWRSVPGWTGIRPARQPGVGVLPVCEVLRWGVDELKYNVLGVSSGGKGHTQERCKGITPIVRNPGADWATWNQTGYAEGWGKRTEWGQPGETSRRSRSVLSTQNWRGSEVLLLIVGD